MGWSPAETLRQHEGWPTHSHAHQATKHLFRDPLVKEATMRGEVTQALQRHLNKHKESPMEAAAHLQLQAVRKAAARMVHRKHLLLTHTEQLSHPTTREHMQRLRTGARGRGGAAPRHSPLRPAGRDLCGRVPPPHAPAGGLRMGASQPPAGATPPRAPKRGGPGTPMAHCGRGRPPSPSPAP